jgi:hypothetical protein
MHGLQSPNKKYSFNSFSAIKSKKYILSLYVVLKFENQSKTVLGRNWDERSGHLVCVPEGDFGLAKVPAGLLETPETFVEQIKK